MTQIERIQEQFGFKNIKYHIYPGQAIKQTEQLAVQGLRTVTYAPGLERTRTNHNKGDGKHNDNWNWNNLESDEKYKNHAKKSMFGTLVLSDFYFNDITINGTDYTMLKDNYSIIDVCLIQITKAKNIIETVVQGRSGKIKEYIGDDDYKIKITGILAGDNGYYPHRKVEMLKDFLNLNYQLQITSSFLNEMYHIYNVVVNSYDFQMEEGKYSTQTFSIDLSSDDVNYSDKILIYKY